MPAGSSTDDEPDPEVRPAQTADLDAQVDELFRVLYVCTANVCRSPLAAGLMKLHAESRNVPVEVASAGLLSGGHPADAHVVAILHERGVDASKKVSRRITPRLAEGADLILTMTSDHARQVIGEIPEVQPKLFTLRHFVQLAARRPDERSIHEWLGRMDDERNTSYSRDDPEIDIKDPVGQSRAVFDELATEISAHVSWILRLVHMTPNLLPH